jgi:P-type conjugative transfer protein TrbJ
MQINKKFLLITMLSVFLFKNADAMFVYDPTNWVQNAATAANTAKQLANEAQQIQFVLKDMQNYKGGTGEWANIQSMLLQLGDEVQQGQALAYSMKDLDGQFSKKFPGYVPQQDYQQSYSSWSKTTMDTLRSTLESAGMQANQFGNEQSRLNQLASLSQSAQGRMQALQVGNMIAAEQVTQTQKLRQLVITQVNAENTYASYQVQKESSSEAQTASWINSGDTKFPHYGAKRE